jgi:RNA polymerase sigma-70 factor (ECF subfamily)
MPDETLTDSQLFAQAREGDTDAFALLVNRHKHSLVNYLCRLTGDRDQAEDVAQETFLRLYERGGGYSEEGKLTAYLFRIATNLVHSQGRRTRRWQILRAVLMPPNGHHTEPAQQARLLNRELGHQLNEAVLGLPLRYRAPVVLSQVEGWSYRDIAELVGCREGTVKSRIHRGRQLLREALEPYWNGGQP